MKTACFFAGSFLAGCVGTLTGVVLMNPTVALLNAPMALGSLGLLIAQVRYLSGGRSPA